MSVIPDVEYDNEGWPVMKWFGESWGAPVCRPERHADTPAGAKCAEGCGKPIAVDDRGFLIPLLESEAPPVYLAHHHECWMRNIVGSTVGVWRPDAN